LTIYAERPVVEKQNRYAFYHQSAQAIASYLTDLPYKIINMFVFNILIYFMAGLKREAGAFFFFCLATLLTTLILSALFRTLASITRTPDQAMIPTAVLSLGLMIYTGFTTPPAYMPGWSRWMAYINPLSYGFESLMANEFHGRDFPCASMVPSGPGYTALPSASQVCSVVGSVVGSTIVNGDDYIGKSFDYHNVHKWRSVNAKKSQEICRLTRSSDRNIGILFAFVVFLFPAYILAAELAKPPKTRGEILVFSRIRGFLGPRNMQTVDSENQEKTRPIVADKVPSLPPQKNVVSGRDVFHWEDLCYDIKVKDGTRRLLDHVDGWVKPGMSTILMVCSNPYDHEYLNLTTTIRVCLGQERRLS
jgi:ABC-type multidrug transport system permease subunit